jgi:hypothetical protein
MTELINEGLNYSEGYFLTREVQPRAAAYKKYDLVIFGN